MSDVSNDVRTTPRDRHRAETRAEILAAAWDLCREGGLASLSLRELGGRVGLRAQSLYAYFPSKAAIYDAMFRDGYEQMAAHPARRIADEVLADPTRDPSDDPAAARAVLQAGARAFVEFCVADPTRYQLLFQRTVPGFEPSAESYAVAVEQLTATAAAMATLGVDDPAHLDLWTALLTGLTDQQISNDPGGDRWLRLLDDAVDMFCDHCGIP